MLSFVFTGCRGLVAIQGTSAGESGPGEGSGWSASATPAPAALASAQTEKGSRVFQTFSGPSRAVVTFTLYRSAGPEGNGRPIEKKLFEVEALEHHTLQQVMGKQEAFLG